MQDIRERIKAGEFENQVPYPERPKLDRETMNDRQIREAREAHTAKLQEYHKGSNDAIRRFRGALEEEHKMTKHPKRDRLWDLAWDEGHSSGLVNVVHWYEELVDLAK